MSSALILSFFSISPRIDSVHGSAPNRPPLSRKDAGATASSAPPPRPPPAGARAAHQLRPGVDVPARVADDGRLPRGPRGGVNPHDPLHRDGEQPERVGLPQVVLRRVGMIWQILEPPDVARPVPPLGQ